ncbi:MAG: hypothetical protein R3A11_08350 [Bdellovibrionota bacterium]
MIRKIFLFQIFFVLFHAPVLEAVENIVFTIDFEKTCWDEVQNTQIFFDVDQTKSSLLTFDRRTFELNCLPTGKNRNGYSMVSLEDVRATTKRFQEVDQVLMEIKGDQDPWSSNNNDISSFVKCLDFLSSLKKAYEGYLEDSRCSKLLVSAEVSSQSMNQVSTTKSLEVHYVGHFLSCNKI